jgi:hypothetical protein
MGLELDRVLMLRATVIAAVVGLAAAAGFISSWSTVILVMALNSHH